MKQISLGSIVTVALVFAFAAPLVAASPPETIEVSGQRLHLAGHGTRNELLFVELYSVGLYLPHDMSDAQAIRASAVPKALRVEVRYDGSLPDRIPSSWRSELMPALTPPQQQTLIRQYQQLEQGDTITVSYMPGTGSAVSINGRQILQDKGHEVMNAFLDVWIGRTPVSEDLKQALL